MTEYQWIAGFFLTWTGMVVGGTWAIGKIKQDVSDKIGAEALARTQALAGAVASRDQDLDLIRKEFGETIHAIRRYAETIEKDMREKELWSRDNFVQKSEFERALGSFEKATESLHEDIKEMRSEIKNEFKEIRNEIA